MPAPHPNPNVILRMMEEDVLTGVIFLIFRNRLSHRSTGRADIEVRDGDMMMNRSVGTTYQYCGSKENYICEKIAGLCETRRIQLQPGRVCPHYRYG